MSRILPPLNALRAFESAARHESVTLAAEELNVAHAAISRHIRTLESSLRVMLFERTGRGVRLTDEGRELGQKLTQSFDLIANATSRYARTPKRRQRVTISSDILLATHWLVSRLGRFTSDHPNIDLVVDPSLRLVDFGKEDVDFGIRCGGGVWKNVTSERIASGKLSLVCSPRLLEKQNIEKPSDLPTHLLMREQDRSLWPAWLAAAGVKDKAPAGPALLVDLTMQAAEAGQGFALADDIVAGDALLAGRLVSPFDTRIETYGYYLVHGEDRPLSKAASNFRAWLLSEITATERALATFRARKAPKMLNAGRARAASRASKP